MDAPVFEVMMTRAPDLVAASAVLSVEPSSTTIISVAGIDAALCTANAIVAAALYAGITTVIPDT
jgi:hypothetical protein